MSGLVVVISGPGGVGKGTIARRLVAEDDCLWLSRSWTTRAQRPSEDDEAYNFVDPATFEAHREKGGFLEWATFLGHSYGTPVPESPEGIDLLLEIDVQGARQVRENDPNALLIFVAAPSQAEQARRLRGRGDDDAHVKDRLIEAERELAAAEELKATTVVNDSLDDCLIVIRKIIDEARMRIAAV